MVFGCDLHILYLSVHDACVGKWRVVPGVLFLLSFRFLAGFISL